MNLSLRRLNMIAVLTLFGALVLLFLPGETLPEDSAAGSGLSASECFFLGRFDGYEYDSLFVSDALRRWSFVLDPNDASVGEFLVLPGIGPKLASKIVEQREQNGPYCEAADLERVHGIGPKKRAKMEPYLNFGP